MAYGNKGNGRRPAQVGEAIQREISEIILREMKDPRMGFVTITSVDVSPDLKLARIFVSVLGTDEERQATMVALEKARGWLRHELGGRLDLRAVPDLAFKGDVSGATAQRISLLLNELSVEEARKDATAWAEEGQGKGGQIAED